MNLRSLLTETETETATATAKGALPLFVSRPIGEKIAVEMALNANVGDFKLEIARAIEKSADQIQIHFQGQTFADDKLLLSDSGLSAEAVVDITVGDRVHLQWRVPEVSDNGECSIDVGEGNLFHRLRACLEEKGIETDGKCIHIRFGFWALESYAWLLTVDKYFDIPADIEDGQPNYRSHTIADQRLIRAPTDPRTPETGQDLDLNVEYVSHHWYRLNSDSRFAWTDALRSMFVLEGRPRSNRLLVHVKIPQGLDVLIGNEIQD